MSVPRPQPLVALAAASIVLLAMPVAASAAGSVRVIAVPLKAAAAGRANATTGARTTTLKAIRVKGGFSLAGVHWRGTRKARLQLRSRTLHGAYGPWQAIEMADLPNAGERHRNAPWMSDPAWFGRAAWLQIRVRGRVRDLKAIVVKPGPDPTLRSAPRAAPGQPTILPRSAWGADEKLRKGRPVIAPRALAVVVHHTATPNGYDAAQVPSVIRSLYLYQVRGNGLSDLGYNYLVDAQGRIYEGRYGGVDRNVVGAHTAGFNTGTVGIALIGNFTTASPTTKALRALEALTAWRLDLAHVDPLSKVVRVSAGNPRYAAGTAITLNAISAHRDVYPTSCPGASLYAQLPSLRTAVSQTGLPKLYAPAVVGTLGGPVRFTARLSNAVAWTVTVRDDAGATVASGTGTGTKVDWTWDATAAGGQHYAWSISAPQMRPATGSIGNAQVPLALQKLKLAPAIVTPNGDGRGDEARVSFVLSAAAKVTAKVTNSLDQPVATIFDGARAAGKQELTWAPDAFPDGWYRLTLTAVAGSKQVQTSTRFWVDRTLAATTASAPAFSPRLKPLGLEFTLLNPAHVEVRVLRGPQVVATPFTADLAPGSQQLSWDGSKLPDGRYSIEVNATDSLLTVTQTVVVRIDRKAPALRLVSLRSATVRVSEPGTLVVAVNGRWRKLVVKKAGLVRVPHTGAVRGLTAYAIDPAGNKSRVVSARR